MQQLHEFGVALGKLPIQLREPLDEPRAPALKQPCHPRVEQLGWSPGVELLSADSAESFAEQAARLFGDPELWGQLRGAALDRVGRDCSPLDFDARLAAIIASIDRTGLRP